MKRRQWMGRGWVIGASIVAMLGGSLEAAVKTWSNTGDWFADSGNWAPSPPVAGDEVVVSTGSSLTLTSSPPALLSYTQQGGTLTFEGWGTVLTADTVVVSGTITHPEQSATSTNGAGVWVPDNRVQFDCVDFTLNGDGTIDLDEKGYKQSPAGEHGYGPGRGFSPSSASGRAGGAGHGGDGGDGQYGATGGVENGVAGAPVNPGSSSGGTYGFAGGGAIRIVATGAVTIEGDILASGGGGTDYRNGGGAGGSVWITCNTIEGAGTIHANGGRADSQGGSGAGGRIAIDYDETAQAAVLPKPSLVVSAVNGASAAGLTIVNGIYAEHQSGEAGTVYLTDGSLLRPIVNLGGRLQFADSTASWNPTSLVVSNVTPHFPADFALTVDGSLTVVNGGGLVMQSVSGANGKLDIGGDATFTGGRFEYHFAPDYPDTLSVGGQLSLASGAKAYWYAAPTNASVGLLYGGRLQVASNFTVSGTSTRVYPFSHPTNSGSLKIKVGAFDLQAGSIVSATYKGFWGGAATSGDGYGPGGGKGSSSRGGGGGFGGKGGDGPYGASTAGGPTNGLAYLPVHAGSGGGCGTGQGGLRPGPGGGLVWVVADGAVQIDGQLLANGGNNVHASGGSAGGGVLLVGTSFDMGASALISANGGTGESWGGGGGGGGRVAVLNLNRSGYESLEAGNTRVIEEIDVPSAYTNQISVLGASGYNAGQKGTIYFGTQVFPQGSLIILR